VPERDPARRAVITGLGAVMPIGNDFPTYWSNLVAGVTGTRTIRSFDASAHEVRIAAEVLDFDPTIAMDPKMARRMSRFIHFAMAAGKEAVADSGIDFAAMTPEQRDRVAVVVNTGGGGIEQIIDGTHVHDAKGPRFVSPFAVPALSGSMGAAMLSIEYGLTGPVITQVAACATSVIAFQDALRLIATGEVDVVLAGGTEAPIWPMGVAALANMTALSKRNDSPETASRPFDATRDGFVLGEGAAGLFLEDMELAKARGAHIYAEVVGYGSAADGWDMIQPIEHGAGSSRTMQMALDRRGVPADEVDLINPHGTSTPMGDKREAEAIWTVFGERSAASAKSLAISGTKSMTGHMMGAAGAFEAFATVMSVDQQCVPPTVNFRDPDPECDLWVVTEATAMPVRYALSNNIGLGGHNGAVIFKRYDG
jgi:3-oxoacyl-[acyl-carrier-protein] synthase II